MRRLRCEQRQGEPAFERCKARMEQVRKERQAADAERPHFRSAADADRHRQARVIRLPFFFVCQPLASCGQGC